MLVMQNSPQRHEASLLGHIIIPHACERALPTLMRHP